MAHVGRWLARGGAILRKFLGSAVAVLITAAALVVEAVQERTKAWYDRWRSQPYLDMADALFRDEEFAHFEGNAAAQIAVRKQLLQDYNHLHQSATEARRAYLVGAALNLATRNIPFVVLLMAFLRSMATVVAALPAEPPDSFERILPPVAAALQAQWAPSWQLLSIPGGLILFTVIVGGWLWIRFDSGRRRWSLRVIYDDFVRQQVAPIMRSCLSEVANDPQASPGFAITVAPGLTSEIGPDKTVTRPEFRRLADLVTELGASTIALSGTRGAGKSTLLKAVTEPYDDTVLGTKRTLRIAVRAPVSYDPREFVVHLFTRVCDEFLEKNWASSRRSARLIGGIAMGAVRLLLRLALTAAIIALWIPKMFPDFRIPGTDHPLPTTTLSTAIALGVTLFLLLCYAPLERLRPYVPTKHSSLLVQKVQRQRDRLSNLRVLTTETGGAFAFAGSSLAGKRFRQVSELPLTLPEITDAYRDLVQEIADAVHPLASPALIIGIDEIDRIANPEDVEQFLNEIKAIFSIPGCVYVVTVSADALAHFERRVSGIRGAVDSTFDDVIRVGTFSLDESREMLHQRLAGVPDFYVALCHCLSGGIPRDLVRCARSLVTQRKMADTSDRDTLTIRLVAHEIRRLLEGFAHQAAALEPGEQRSSLLRLLDPVATGTGETFAQGAFEAVMAKAHQLAEQEHLDDDQASQIARAAAASVAYHATVLCVFLADDTGTVMVDRLTAIHHLLAVDPDLAERHLAMLTDGSRWASSGAGHTPR